MSTITYLVDDATDPKTPGPKMIAHICNDMGGWGKGFVLAISNRWPACQFDYRSWHKQGVSTPNSTGEFHLGMIQTVYVQPDIWVVNMIAQHGYRSAGGKPPIRYDALTQCLRHLRAVARSANASVHMPRIGCGLAGGSWDVIEPMIQSQLVDHGIQVFVYDLP